MEIVLGVAGLLLILGAFVMEEFERHTRHQSLAYNTINLCGALFLTVYAVSLRTWPFVVLNVVWMLIATAKIHEILGKQRKKKSR